MNLKRKCRMCGLTQHQVARLTNIPLSRICYAESGPHPGEDQFALKVVHRGDYLKHQMVRRSV